MKMRIEDFGEDSTLLAFPFNEWFDRLCICLAATPETEDPLRSICEHFDGSTPSELRAVATALTELVSERQRGLVGRLFDEGVLHTGIVSLLERTEGVSCLNDLLECEEYRARFAADEGDVSVTVAQLIAEEIVDVVGEETTSGGRWWCAEEVMFQMAHASDPIVTIPSI